MFGAALRGVTAWLSLGSVMQAAVALRDSLSCQIFWGGRALSSAGWCADVSEPLDALCDSGQFTGVFL
jgi:hypothetical protein